MTDEGNLENFVNYLNSELKYSLLLYAVSVLCTVVNFFNIFALGGILYQLAFAVLLPISLVLGHKHERLKNKLREAQFRLNRVREGLK